MRELLPRKPDPFWPDLDDLLPWPWSWRPPVPPVDIEETDDAYIVTAELPGFEKDDIEIQLYNNVLILRGEKVEREGRRFLRRERTKSISRFERQLRFGADIDHEGVKAEFKQGELVITLPKAQRQKTRTITIE